MKNIFLPFIGIIFLFLSCNKAGEAILNAGLSGSGSGQVIQYSIKKGQQFCDKNDYKPVSVSEMKFVVRFDSTAIYHTASPVNQYDINKLYGFSDNNEDHHQYSARFGWRWSDNALRLFGYVYNKGTVTSQELGTVPIGKEITCSIKVYKDNYTFNINGDSTRIIRFSTTATGAGYQLYPYFGGEETAPHDINIWIKDEK